MSFFVIFLLLDVMYIYYYVYLKKKEFNSCFPFESNGISDGEVLTNTVYTFFKLMYLFADI